MSTEPKATEQPEEEEYDVTPEEEDLLEARYHKSIEEQRQGKLIPWEAVFPPRRQAG